jgi:hypothetical protein
MVITKKKCSPIPLLIFVSIRINLLIQIHASFGLCCICSGLDIFTSGTSIGILN